MNVLIDTNVVFDVVEKRQPHYAASNQVLGLCRRRVLAGIAVRVPGFRAGLPFEFGLAWLQRPLASALARDGFIDPAIHLLSLKSDRIGARTFLSA